MKFKTIFLVFNIVLVFSFAIIYFMPLIMLGWDYTKLFWAKNWYLPVIFILVIAALNVYFIINWKVFHYLEREDWDSLIAYIEGNVYKENKYREQLIKILLNAYLVKSDIASIEKMEAHLSANKPGMLPKFAIQLGIPHLLKNDSGDMLAYYSRFLDTASAQDREWIAWNHAFALMMGNEREDAKARLSSLVTKTRDPLLKLLTLYLLDSFVVTDDAVRELSEAEKKALKEKCPPSVWEGVVEKGRTNVQVVVLSKLIKDAQTWLFSEKAPS